MTFTPIMTKKRKLTFAEIIFSLMITKQNDDEAAVLSAEGDVSLKFNGDEAICCLTIYTDNIHAVVTGALILTGPSSYSTSWNILSEGCINEYYSAYVTESGLYTLTFDGYCGGQKLNFRARGTKL